MIAWLRWKLRFGQHEATLKEQVRRGWKIPGAEEPELDMRHAWLLAGFRRLSASRPASMGSALMPIPLRDVLQWLDFEGVTVEGVRRDAVDCIEALDEVFRDHMAAKQEST
jgi:hypothetical protein